MGIESGVWEMTSETRRIQVSGSSVKHWADLTYSTTRPWRLTATFNDGTLLEAEQLDLFECLRAVRCALDEEGALLCCEGARRDVFPSGMARQMGGGRKAYRIATDRVLVDIFAPTDCNEVCTVDEQAESVERLLRRG